MLEKVRPAESIVVEEHDELPAAGGYATIRRRYVPRIVGVRNQHNLGKERADALGRPIRRSAVGDNDGVWDGLFTKMPQAPLSELQAVVGRDDDVYRSLRNR